jgi:hypothetical protein
MLPLMPLVYTWLVVTVITIVLVVMRRVMESHEQDWLPISSPTGTEQIQTQQQIERKVHKLTPVLHWAEAADVLLLLLVIGVWIYNGVYFPQPGL